MSPTADHVQPIYTRWFLGHHVKESAPVPTDGWEGRWGKQIL